MEKLEDRGERPWCWFKIQVLRAGFHLVSKNQSCEGRDKRDSQQDVCGWSSWHEILAFMFIFGCIFLSPLMQISGLGSNPTVHAPELPKVSPVFCLGRRGPLSLPDPRADSDEDVGPGTEWGSVSQVLDIYLECCPPYEAATNAKAKWPETVSKLSQAMRHTQRILSWDFMFGVSGFHFSDSSRHIGCLWKVLLWYGV
jgi:hypothetical protein